MQECRQDVSARQHSTLKLHCCKQTRVTAMCCCVWSTTSSGICVRRAHPVLARKAVCRVLKKLLCCSLLMVASDHLHTSWPRAVSR